MVRLALPVLVLLALAVSACGGSREPGPEPGRFGELPLTFVEQQGDVRFLAQGPGHSFFVTPDQIALTLERPSGQGVALKLRFLDSNPRVEVGGETRSPGTVNYIGGANPRTGVPAYEGVVYRDLWPGIDMALRGNGGELKYEFRVRPGADVRDIRLAYQGADGLRVDGGALMIDTALGELRDSKPIAFQDGRPIAASYALHGRDGYGFSVGRHDPARELVIDPGLAYSTFLGGASNDVGRAITVDGAGNSYVTGFTQSPNFPTTTGAYDRSGSASNDLDAFVTKLNPAGTAPVYSTFIGGTNFDWGRAITIDATGAAYVTGQTKSSNFPVTGGAFDRSFNVDTCPRCGIDQYDAFVLKLNPAGSALVYSTFLGGFDLDDSLGIALDASRNAYVTGQTVSSNFPVTGGAFDTTPGGGFDAFVAKLNATGSALVYSTRLGGEDNELPEDLRVDAGGNAVVGGSTRSSGFPTTAGAFDTTQNGGAFDERFDLFVTKLNPAGSGLVYSTFIGGSKSDFGDDFALDGAGNAYMVGATLSPDFPTTPGAFDRAFAGSAGFALKLDPTGSRLSYSTFLGEAGAAAVAPASDGSVWLAGASGPGGTTTADAFDPFFNGGPADAYIARLNASGSALEFASFLGGSESEAAGDVALDGAGNVYVTGHTYSPDFTTTAGAFDRTWAGDPLIFWGDAFVAKIDVAATAPPVPSPAPAPAAPALLAPATDASSPVAFDWSDVSGASSYTIQVDEISAFGAPLILSTSTTASSLTTALPNGNWFWRVRAVNSEGTPGAWSEVRAIAVGVTTPPPEPVPAAPSLTSPAAGATVSQPFTFDWGDVANAGWYVIEVDDSSDFGSLVWAATTTPSQLATNSLPNGPLFWRVRAFNTDGVAGPYSAVRTLTVGTGGGSLPAPSLQSPADDARFNRGQSITFNWTDVAGASGYTIQIDDSQSFSAPLTLEQAVTASQFTTSTLPARRMWWRVRADNGAWSASRRFEVRN